MAKVGLTEFLKIKCLCGGQVHRAVLKRTDSPQHQTHRQQTTNADHRKWKPRGQQGWRWRRQISQAAHVTWLSTRSDYESESSLTTHPLTTTTTTHPSEPSPSLQACALSVVIIVSPTILPTFHLHHHPPPFTDLSSQLAFDKSWSFHNPVLTRRLGHLTAHLVPAFCSTSGNSSLVHVHLIQYRKVIISNVVGKLPQVSSVWMTAHNTDEATQAKHTHCIERERGEAK